MFTNSLNFFTYSIKGCNFIYSTKFNMNQLYLTMLTKQNKCKTHINISKKIKILKNRTSRRSKLP